MNKITVVSIFPLYKVWKLIILMFRSRKSYNNKWFFINLLFSLFSSTKQGPMSIIVTSTIYIQCLISGSYATFCFPVWITKPILIMLFIIWYNSHWRKQSNKLDNIMIRFDKLMEVHSLIRLQKRLDSCNINRIQAK